MINDEHRNQELEQLDRALKDASISLGVHELKEHPSLASKALEVIGKQFQIMTSCSAKSNVISHIGKIPGAADLLLSVFRQNRASILKPEEGAANLGWIIGEELRTTVKARHVDNLISLLNDRAYGKARQMLPYALARFKRRRDDIIPVLVNLLDDEDVMGQVLGALRQMKAIEAIPAIIPCLNHPHWDRQAQKTLTKLGVTISQQADEIALASYREKGAAIALSNLSMVRPTDDLEGIVFTVAAIASDGFSYSDAMNLIYRERDMEVEETDSFGFDVVFDGSNYPLYIEIFMDDVDVPAISCFTGKPLAEKIQELLPEVK